MKSSLALSMRAPVAEPERIGGRARRIKSRGRFAEDLASSTHLTAEKVILLIIIDCFSCNSYETHNSSSTLIHGG
jgi:hypothetical protein